MIRSRVPFASKTVKAHVPEENNSDLLLTRAVKVTPLPRFEGATVRVSEHVGSQFRTVLSISPTVAVMPPPPPRRHLRRILEDFSGCSLRPSPTWTWSEYVDGQIGQAGCCCPLLSEGGTRELGEGRRSGQAEMCDGESGQEGQTNSRQPTIDGSTGWPDSFVS